MNRIPREESALRGMSVADFANFGVPVVAYVKPVIDDTGHKAYALHGADGVQIGVEDSMDLAALTARHKNLYPVLIQ